MTRVAAGEALQGADFSQIEAEYAQAFAVGKTYPSLMHSAPSVFWVAKQFQNAIEYVLFSEAVVNVWA